MSQILNLPSAGGVPGGATTLSGLSDVDLTPPPAGGENLTFSSGKWRPVTASGITTVVIISGVTATSGTLGFAPVVQDPTPTSDKGNLYNKGGKPNWNSTVTSGEVLVGVFEPSIADNEVLAYNAATSKWINQTAAEAGLSEAGHSHGAASVERQFIFTVDGAVAVASGNIRIPNHLASALAITKVYGDLTTSPTGTALICDLNIDGTTIFSNQANRLTIPISGASAVTSGMSTTAWPTGSYMTMDIDQVGSIVAGSYLTVTVVAQ